MKIAPLKRIEKQDLANKGDLPAWLDVLIQTLNQMFPPVVTALQKNLTLNDNFFGRQSDIKLTSGVSQKISSQSIFKVIGVQVLDIGGNTLTKFKWSRNTDATISVSLTWDEGGSAMCKLFLYFG